MREIKTIAGYLYTLIIDWLTLTIPIKEKYERQSIARNIEQLGNQYMNPQIRDGLKQLYTYVGQLVLKRGKFGIYVTLACDPRFRCMHYLYLSVNVTRLQPEHRYKLRDCLIRLCGPAIGFALMQARVSRLDPAHDFMNQWISDMGKYPLDIKGRSASRQWHDDGFYTNHFGCGDEDMALLDVDKHNAVLMCDEYDDDAYKAKRKRKSKVSAREYDKAAQMGSDNAKRRLEFEHHGLCNYAELEDHYDALLKPLSDVDMYSMARLKTIAGREKGTKVWKKSAGGNRRLVPQRPAKKYVSKVLEMMGEGRESVSLTTAIRETAKCFAPDDADSQQLARRRYDIRKAMQPALEYSGFDKEQAREQLIDALESVHDLMKVLTSTSLSQGADWLDELWGEDDESLKPENQTTGQSRKKPTKRDTTVRYVTDDDYCEPDELDDIDD